MSSNRLIYDKCAYETEIKESTSQLYYNLYKGKYENLINCPITDYTNILPIPTRADIENELYGLNRHGSLCPSMKYNPNSKFKSASYSPPKLCENIYYMTPNNIEKPVSTMLKTTKIEIPDITNSCITKK